MQVKSNLKTSKTLKRICTGNFVTERFAATEQANRFQTAQSLVITTECNQTIITGYMSWTYLMQVDNLHKMIYSLETRRHHG